MNDFFQVLKSIMPNSDVTYKMVISRKLETISVTVIPVIKEGKEFDLPAFSCKGTAQELDEKFMHSFAQVVNQNTHYVSNILDYEKQITALALKKKEELSKKIESKKITQPNSKSNVASNENFTDTEFEEQIETKSSKAQKIKSDVKKLLETADRYEGSENWDLAVYTYNNILKNLKPEENSELIETIEAKLELLGSKATTYQAPSSIGEPPIMNHPIQRDVQKTVLFPTEKRNEETIATNAIKVAQPEHIKSSLVPLIQKMETKPSSYEDDGLF